MDTVRLKSRVGPLHLTRRMKYGVERYDFTFDNSLKQELPVDYWQELEHEYLDRAANLKYKDALIEL